MEEGALEEGEEASEEGEDLATGGSEEEALEEVEEEGIWSMNSNRESIKSA